LPSCGTAIVIGCGPAVGGQKLALASAAERFQTRYKLKAIRQILYAGGIYQVLAFR